MLELPETQYLFAMGIVALGTIPAGYAAALAARALAARPVPVVAMIAAAVPAGVCAAYVLGPGYLLAASCAMGWVLLVLAAVDALAFRLPDILTIPLAAGGIAMSWFLPDRDVAGHVIGAAAGSGAFYAIATIYRIRRGQDGLGMGDVKLAGAMGAWLGWQALPFAVLVACAVGLVWVGIGALRRGKDALKERIPFGVALCFALWFVWLYGVPEVLS